MTGHIIPWNYPMQILGRSVGAALAMGNAAVLKPAEEACLTALAFADICHQAGLPKGALNVVPGLGEEAVRRSQRIPASTTFRLPALSASASRSRRRRRAMSCR